MSNTDINSTSIDSIKLNVSRMTKDEAVSILKMLASIAKESGNLDSVFSSNGSSGRGANGRYSLIAKATGISRTHIARIFNREKNPSIETLTIIANTADISKESLLEYITA